MGFVMTTTATTATAFFVFSDYAGDNDDGKTLFELPQDNDAIEASDATEAVLKVISGFYDAFPGDATYVVVEVPVGTRFKDVFVQESNETFYLADAYADAPEWEVSIDEDDWDEFKAADEEDEEDEEDQVSLINGVRDYDGELRLMTDRPVNLNGVPCAVVSVYRRHDETAYAFEAKVYPTIRRGQESMGAQALREAVEKEMRD